MEFKDIARSLAAIGLPLLGAALPVPGGAALGAALAARIGASSDTAADILAKVTTDPEALLKAKQFEAENNERLTALVCGFAAEMYRTEVADREGARRAAIEGGGARRTFWFAVLIFVAVCAVEGWVLIKGLPAGTDMGVAGRVLGSLDAAMLVALYYIFGSSSGSERKTAMQWHKQAD